LFFFFFFSSRRRHTRSLRDWSSDVCSSDLADGAMPADSAYLGGGFLGAACAPLSIGAKDHTQDPSAPDFRVTALDTAADVPPDRSEERRVGKEGRSRRWPDN